MFVELLPEAFKWNPIFDVHCTIPSNLSPLNVLRDSRTDRQDTKAISRKHRLLIPALAQQILIQRLNVT